MIRKILILTLVLLMCSACNHKKSDMGDLFLLLLLNQLDRAENYDHDIEIITDQNVPSSYGSLVNYELNSENELIPYRQLLLSEMAKYPRGYWIKAKAGKVVLVKNLTVSGQYRAAVPDPSFGLLFLSVNGAGSGATNEYLIHVMHHELNHNVDFAHYGNMFVILPEWNLLNTGGFEYGSGGATAYANLGIPWGALTNPVPGFIDLYSMLGQEEDRSEIVGVIMGSPSENEVLRNICAADSIVRAKANLMTSILNHFWPFSGAEGSYWKTKIETISCP